MSNSVSGNLLPVASDLQANDVVVEIGAYTFSEPLTVADVWPIGEDTVILYTNDWTTRTDKSTPVGLEPPL